MKLMAIDYYGDGKFKEIGPARWDELGAWARSFRRIRDVDWAGFTAIYAVTCTLGGTHHYLVQETPDRSDDRQEPVPQRTRQPRGSGRS